MTLPGGPQQHGSQGWQPPAPQQGQPQQQPAPQQGQPQPAPQQGQPYPPQYPNPQQPYPPQYPQQWGPPPPPPRGRKGGVLIGVLATILVLGLAFAGYWVFYERGGGSSEKPPPVDTSQDLEKAPIGCAMFDEAEVAPYIPGRMEFEPGGPGANSGAGEFKDQGQCSWSNSDTFTEDGVRPAGLTVTSYVYHANHELSGVDKAKDHLESRVRNGVSVAVTGADEALLAEQTADFAVDVTIRYRNVVYHLSYRNQTEGANVKGPAVELANIALSKVVPADGG